MQYLFSVLSSFAFISLGTRESLLLFFNSILHINYMAVSVLCLFFTVLLVGLQYVIVVFPGHTHFLFAHKVKLV